MGTDKIEVTIAPYGKDPVTQEPNQPNPTQQRILDWVDRVRANKQDHIPVLYIQGGVGSGKSRGILAVILELLCEIPGLRVLWGRQDYKDLKLSIMDKFFEILPPELIKAKSEQYSWYDILQSDGKSSRIYFNGLKDIGGLGSQEFGVIAVTEAHQVSHQSYMALKRRCRQENVVNIILMESEPPNEDHWLNALTDSTKTEYDPDVEMWELSTYENWHNLPQTYTGSLEGMPDAWKKKYLMGKCGFIPSGKSYYQGFNIRLHQGEFDYVPEKELLLGWDFGFHHPALVVTQLDNQDRWLILRELLGHDVTIYDFAEQAKQFLNYYFPDGKFLNFGDPACIQKNDKSEQTSWQVLAERGFTLSYRQSEYRLRKEIIEGKLATLVSGKPQLMVDSRYCSNIIDGFLGGYHYPERKDTQQFTYKFEMPFKDGFYEHLMNALEYIAVNMFRPVRTKQKPRFTYKRRVHRDNI